MQKLIDKLHNDMVLTPAEFTMLLTHLDTDTSRYLFSRSRARADQLFGPKIFIRGLIEFTSFCRNDCYYCGIRKSNHKASRYRLGKEDILSCCQRGYELGFRTFVLQGGEDLWYTDDKIIDLISSIKSSFPDCAITLSLGEKTAEQYQAYFDAGADRYLLRHETANARHYAKLHPAGLCAANRQRCLYDLKQIGYQAGAGFMVGSPYQTVENLVEDLLFINKLRPHMIGIGPFIPHQDTPFAQFPSGSLHLTLVLIAILRLLLPNALIPATTALATIHPEGRKMGILAGANVVMPNLSPLETRKKYLLYNNKMGTGEEAAEGLSHLQQTLQQIGYEITVDRGDFRSLL